MEPNRLEHQTPPKGVDLCRRGGPTTKGTLSDPHSGTEEEGDGEEGYMKKC